MTTGRINQVTILLAGAGRVAGADPHHDRDTTPPGKGGQKLVLTRQGRLSPGEEKRPTGDRATPVEGAAVDYGHPIAPTEFPKGWSAATTRSVPGGDNHEAMTYTPQEEDTKGQSHQQVDGYQPRLTPRNLRRILAKGQSSTDLVLTEALEASRISVMPSPHEEIRYQTISQAGIVRRPFSRKWIIGQAGIQLKRSSQ